VDLLGGSKEHAWLSNYEVAEGELSDIDQD
jgi:hypothetical protein